MIDLNFLIFYLGPRDMVDFNFLIFHQGPRDWENQKIQVNKSYHISYSTVILLTVGSGGALWVLRDSPDFRAHTDVWAPTNS